MNNPGSAASLPIPQHHTTADEGPSIPASLLHSFRADYVSRNRRDFLFPTSLESSWVALWAALIKKPSMAAIRFLFKQSVVVAILEKGCNSCKSNFCLDKCCWWERHKENWENKLPVGRGGKSRGCTGVLCPMPCTVPKMAAMPEGPVSNPETWRRLLIQQTPMNVPWVSPLSGRHVFIYLYFLPFFHCHFFPAFLSPAREKGHHRSMAASQQNEGFYPLHKGWYSVMLIAWTSWEMAGLQSPQVPSKTLLSETRIVQGNTAAFLLSSSTFLIWVKPAIPCFPTLSFIYNAQLAKSPAEQLVCGEGLDVGNQQDFRW